MKIPLVTASGSAQVITEAPSTMILVTAEQIAERGYEQIDDVLRDMEGIDLIETHGQVPSFMTFRGMYGDENRRIAFMIDGILENSIMGGIEMGGPAYSLHNVERIEIIRGPASALHGANAFSGVINIITKKAKDINGLHYRKGFGSYNTSFDNVIIGLEKSNISLVMSGSLYNSDGPVFLNRHPRYSNSYIDNAWSFNGNVTYTHDSLRTTFGFRSYRTPSGSGLLGASPTELFGLPTSGNLNTGTGGTLEADYNAERGSLTETYATTGFITSEYPVNRKFKLLGSIYYRETGRAERSYSYVNVPGTDFVRRTPSAYFSNRVRSHLSFVYSLTGSDIISAGVSLSQDNLELGFRAVNTDTSFQFIHGLLVTNLYPTYRQREFIIQNNLGAHLQYVKNTTLLNITLGVRYDNNSIYGTTVNPRIGIVNHPVKNLTIKVLYGSAFRAPSNFELYTNETGTRISNPGLKPERVKSYEANLIYIPYKSLLLQANLFLNNLTDVIIQDMPIGGGITQNQNSGSAFTRGFELRLEYFPDKKFSAYANLTWQEGRLNTGHAISDMPNIARLKGNASVTVRAGSLFNITLTGHWMGKRSVAVTNPLGEIPGYFIADFVLTTRSFFDERVTGSFRIHNLFNHKYLDPGYRAANGLLYGTVMEQPGINGLFKIAVSLY